MLPLLVVSVAAALAFANGANDVSKGVAPLVGSGVAGYRSGIAWGTAWTAAGAVLGAAFAGAMLATFGKGLLAPGVTPGLGAAFAALFGAAAWVALATRTGLPVSTTHAIVGAIVGATMTSRGIDAIRWSALVGKVVVPLLLSPVVAFILTAGLVSGVRLQLTRGPVAECAAHRPDAARATLGHLQWVGSAATSLARGMNDAPKMVALGLAAAALGVGEVVSAPVLYSAVTAGMVVGGLVAGRRVTTLLAEKITVLDTTSGLAANGITALLVAAGAFYGLPMSTTHVAAGGLTGVGAMRGSVNWATVRQMALAWVVTLPASAALAGLAQVVAGVLGA